MMRPEQEFPTAPPPERTLTAALDRVGPVPESGTSRSRLSRAGIGTLLTGVAVLLSVVIATPIALSSQDLIGWAGAPTGLGLPDPWPVLVFIALDAAAAVCVLLTIYCAWRGEPAGVFGAFVWCFALGSAFANYRHATAPGSPPDAAWFFPAMSIAGPALLEAVLTRCRRWVQRDTGRRGRATPSFGWRRWTPGLGAFTDTYGSYRTALLLGIDTVEASITAYHQLCPDGSLKVASALRARHTSDDAEPSGDTPDLAVDLMRRIPVQPDAYRRWRTTWADIRNGADSSQSIAARHGCSVRQVEFIRGAGRLGFLESPLPPAVRLAQAHLTGAPLHVAPQ